MKLSYSNVVATLALFIALGGGAYAAVVAKNSVGSKQIKPDSVKGVDVNEGTLGAVPHASDSDNVVVIDSDDVGNRAQDYELGELGPIDLALSCDTGSASILAKDSSPNEIESFDFGMVRALDGLSPEALTGSTSVTDNYKVVLSTLTAGEGQFVVSSGTFTYENAGGQVVSSTYSFSAKTVPAETTCRFVGTGLVP